MKRCIAWAFGCWGLLAGCTADEPSTDDSTTTAEPTSTSSTTTTGSTTGATAPCADAPVGLDHYFAGAVGTQTRLLNELVLADDCSWAFEFTDCMDVASSSGTFTIDGDTVVLVGGDGGAFGFIDGSETSEVTLSAGADCNQITVEFEDEDGAQSQTWSRGEPCLSGPSCCMDCTMVPPVPTIEYCTDPPAAC